MNGMNSRILILNYFDKVYLPKFPEGLTEGLTEGLANLLGQEVALDSKVWSSIWI